MSNIPKKPALEINREFRSAALKLENALAHANRLDGAMIAYLDSIRRRVFVEQFPHRRVWLHTLYVSPGIPEELSLIASDATSNIRQSLDHAACAVARSIGKTDNGVYFPFGKDRNDLEDQIGKKARKLPESIKDCIRELEPTPHGNPLLSALHELNVSDKHRKLFTLGMDVDQEFHTIDLSTSLYSMLDSFIWNESDNSLPFATTTSPPHELQCGAQYGPSLQR